MLQTPPTIMWRRIDKPGHESARLYTDASGPVLDGMAVFGNDGDSCAMSYKVKCDRMWRTTGVDVNGWMGGKPINMRASRDMHGRWVVNNIPTPSLDGCEDIDLSFSPATNALAIRRLDLKVGERAKCHGAWWKLPVAQLLPLEHVYERVAPVTYRYSAANGAFVAILEVRADGHITRYPGFWEEVRR